MSDVQFLFTLDFVNTLKCKYSSLAVDFNPSPKKSNAAYANYGISKTQNIIALIDCTLLGSVKNCGVDNDTIKITNFTSPLC